MYEELIAGIALTMGAAWASGINLYATLFVLGFMGGQGYIDLPPSLEILENEIVVAVAFLMYWIEFFMDKVPGVDSGWDGLHTFVRIPAGAVVAAAAVGDVDPVMQVAAGILGGGLTASSHAAKSGTRVLINTTPEPFSNWTASVTEDLLVIGGLWTALNYPVLFLVLLAAWILLLVWLAPKLWRGIKKLAATVTGWFSSQSDASSHPVETDPDTLPETLRIPVKRSESIPHEPEENSACSGSKPGT